MLTSPTRLGCPHTHGQRWLEEQDSASLKDQVSKCFPILPCEPELSVALAARKALGSAELHHSSADKDWGRPGVNPVLLRTQ